LPAARVILGVGRIRAVTESLHFVHYLPIATPVISAIICFLLFQRYRQRHGMHLLWWGLGVLAYGVGTAFEGSITLFGNSIFLTKGWYIAGALFGGYPLAQGSVYLHLGRKTGHRLTALTLPILAAVSLLVILSPVDMAAFQAHRPSGAILGWSWVRLMTPFINLYAVIFLIGGAILSAVRYAKGRTADDRSRALGNALIAFGAILPGVGGGMAKSGLVEALYVGELVGLLFIWAGYWLCTRAPLATVQRTLEATSPA
jgi:hypothetical protein